jgi:hypothetical protein
MTGKSEPFSFRLDKELATELKRCATTMGVSPGELAKQLVIKGLTNSVAESTRMMVAEIRNDLHLMREEHLTAVHALLVHAGKVTPESASDFVANKLLKRDQD